MKPLALTCAVLMIASPVFAQSSTAPKNDGTMKSGTQSTSPGTKSTAAPNTANSATPGQKASVISTKDFVTKAAQSDMYEIQSSQLIAGGGVKDEATKSFAQHMIEDHAKTTKELKQLLHSAKADVAAPKAMSNAQQKMLSRLKTLKGDALSAEYRKEQVSAHEKAVDLFRAYSNTGDNEALKKWAGDTLPALQEHLKMAQALSK
ncbi:MAG TPA: DUF4142 domain-containing protein [Ensifer sp.]|nr:DUF4142 domain-containing protein [Ensifer sp.]